MPLALLQGPCRACRYRGLLRGRCEPETSLVTLKEMRQPQELPARTIWQRIKGYSPEFRPRQYPAAPTGLVFE